MIVDNPPENILALVHPRRKPCVLVGTPRQIETANPIRERLIFQFGRAKRVDLVPLLYCIQDARWFIKNNRKELVIAWPAIYQMEGPEITGRCASCQENAYDYEDFCSIECQDYAKARRIV